MLAAIGACETFCGCFYPRCRSAYLVSVQTNFLLSIMQLFPTVRTAASEAMPPWQAVSRPIKSKVDGDCGRVTNRRQSGSEDRSNPSRIAANLSRHFHSGGIALLQARDCRSSLSLGVPKGVFSFAKENTPFAPCSAIGAATSPAHGRVKEKAPQPSL